MKLVFEKPAAGVTVHYIIKCDLEVPASIHKHGDKLRLEWSRYSVRDRYHVLLRYYCQRFGHMKANCTARANVINRHVKSVQVSKKTKADFKKYINCLRANRGGESDHTVNEHSCPLLVSKLLRLRQGTHYQTCLFLKVFD